MLKEGILLEFAIGVCETAFIIEDAMPCLPKPAELCLVEKISGPQLILAVSKGAILIVALSSLEEDTAQPRT
jgi:hypothetical protein